jgi:phosphatidylglycerol:prolipoprotein diacylglycerol transferase
MIAFPDIDPVIFRLGPLQVRWYGMMYVLGFLAVWFLVKKQMRDRADLAPLEPHFENLNFTLIISLILGGRLGYVFFYNPGYYLAHPLEILATWQGGMSFHGALIGILLGGFLFSRRYGVNFFGTADVYIVTAPIGLFLGRLGNFINGELFGRPADVPWAMIFPEGGPLPRHPSQLYEAFLEGVVLFGVLWSLRNRKMPSGSLFALFLVLYGLMRFLVEYFREPDPQLGFVVAGLTMGQLLSTAMVMAGGTGFCLLYWRKR